MEAMNSGIDREDIVEILQPFKGGSADLIPVLQEIQEKYGYIPRQSIQPISETLRVFPSQIQGVVTFYAQFSLTPRGKNIVRICRGTACHVRGGKSILKVAQQQLGIGEGETREDMTFTLETVACLGTCFLAPAMMVNRNYFGKLVPHHVKSIFREYE